MATIDPSRYSELCRLCAATTTMILAVHIFQNEGVIGQLRKKIESCLSIQVHETDELPKMVCENCIYKLNLLFEFKEKTQLTERLFLNLLKELDSNKIVPSQELNVVAMDHELILAQNQLLASHQMSSVDDIDLSQLSAREQMIVGHEIILSHSLDDIHINQEISGHNLPSNQNSALVNGSDNPIKGDRFAGNNLNSIQHQQLSEHFRLHHINMGQEHRINEITLETGGTVNGKVNNSLQHPEQNFYLHSDKIEHIEHNLDYRNSDCRNLKKQLESPKLEDCNSDNSLLIDEQLIQNGDKEVYLVNDELTSVYKEETSFEVSYESQFYKCETCFDVFPNEELLNVHNVESHVNLENKTIKTRLKRAILPPDSNSEDSEGDFVDNLDQLDDEETDHLSIPIFDNNTGKRKSCSPKVCKDCGKTYKTNYKLNEHMRKHTGEKPYKCDSCDKEFRSKIGLAQHAAKHTGKYDYACPICGKGFQCKSYLMVHQRVHSDEKPYPCSTCGRNFKTKQSLLDHTNRHLGVKPYMCDICGRGFITKGLCKAHQKIHTGLDNRKYSCTVCKKMFVSKSYLQTHLKIHTGEKPFICEVCGKGFLTKVDLRIHTTMHTGEKSYVCEMCGKAFARRDALRCHRRSHTGERPYSCDVCGQTFTQFTPMAIHKRLHTGERPYTCEVCGKTFVSRSTMMSHAKKHR